MNDHRGSGTRARARGALALAAALVALAGCGAPALLRRGDPLDARTAPRPATLADERAEAESGAALDPRSPYWPYRVARIQLAADSVGPATRSLDAALALDPAYAPALALRSRIDYDAGRHEDAVRRIEAARARPGAFPDGAPPALLAALALHYDALGRPDLARGVTATLAHRDDDADAALVYLALRGPAPDSAAPLAARIARADSRSAANHNNLGITRLRAGDPAGAARAFERAIALDPRLPGPYYNLAILAKYYRLDDAAAADWFRRYRERASDDPDGLAEAVGAPAGGDLADRKEAR